MTATVQGNALTSLVEQPGSPALQSTENGVIVTRIYKILATSAAGATPAYGTADATYTSSYLREVYLDGVKGNVATLRFVYKPDNFIVSPIERVGTITFEADSNSIEVPIEENPNYSRSWDKPGVTSYMVPAPVFRRTEILNSFTWSEANVIANVGKRQNPTGMISPTSNAWLKTSLSVRQNGSSYEKVETWQHAGVGRTWDTDIYSAA